MIGKQQGIQNSFTMSSTRGREYHESRPLVADLFLACG